MRVGFDTGFFIKLGDGDPRAVEVWGRAERGDLEGAISCLTLFELERLGLRGTAPREVVSRLITHIPVTCQTVWLGIENAFLLSRSARLAHGNGLSMADAIILTSLIHAGATVIYTTDSDFLAYKAGPQIVKL